jgi:putative peptidoglycan lipid II flippase
MRLSFCLGGITAGNMLLWFLFQGLILAEFGPGTETDALFAALAFPQLILAIANSSMMHVLVPFFSGESDMVVRRNAYSIVLLLIGAFASFAALLHLTAHLWVPWLVIGFAPSAKSLTVSLARIQLLGMVFAVISSVLLSVCHARHKFIRAELAPFLATTAALLGLDWAMQNYGIEGAAWLYSARSILLFLILLPALGRPLWPAFHLVRDVWKSLKLLLASSSYYKSDQLVDRFFTSLVSAGGLSVFYFAQQAHAAGNSIIGKAIAAPMVPALSTYWKTADYLNFYKLYRKRLLLITGVALTCYLVLLLFGEFLLQPLMDFKRIDASNLQQLWLSLALLGGMLVGGSAGLVLAEAFFAKGDTRTPAYTLAGSFTLGIALKSIGFIGFGMPGLAVATSGYFLIYPIILYILLERSLRKLRKPVPSLVLRECKSR